MKLEMRRFILQLSAILVLLISQNSIAGPACSKIHEEAGSSNFETEVRQRLESFSRNYGLQFDWHKANKSVPSSIARQVDGGSFASYSFIGRENESQEQRFELVPKGADPKLPPVNLSPIESHFPYREILGETWLWRGDDHQEHSYRFVNVGNRQLKRDWPNIESAVERALREEKGRKLIMVRSSIMKLGSDILSSWQRWSSKKVTDVYAKRKNYLTPEDLFELRSADDRNIKNDDYLVLLKDSGVPPLKMSSQEYNENVLAVVRLVRMQTMNPMMPKSLFGKFNTYLYQNLPILLRNGNSKSGDMLKTALENLEIRAGKRVAEISRFVRFQEFPEPVMNAFLKNLFELSVHSEEPIDVLVISVDSVTRRLFQSRYRFKDLMPLNEDKGSTSEYVLYLDTSSEEFKRTLSELQERSATVMQKQEIEKPPVSQWARPWESPSENGRSAAFGVMREAHKQIRNLREEGLRRPIKHIVWNIPFLSNQKPADLKRVGQIADWVASGRVGPLVLRDRVTSLSKEEVETLYRNVLLYSNDFAGVTAQASHQVSAEGKSLIVHEGPEEFVQIASSEHNGERLIHRGYVNRDNFGRSEFYDKIFLFEDFFKIKSDAERIVLLKKVAAQLKQGGELTLFGPFADANTPSEVLSESLYKYALDVFENGAPMSERDLALDLMRRRQFIETRLSKVIEASSLRDLARLSGFEAGYSAVIRPGTAYYGGAVTLRKP